MLINCYGARAALKELKVCAKRLVYQSQAEKMLIKHVSDESNRSAPYLATPNGQPVWLFSNLPVTTEDGLVGEDDEGYWEAKRHWREYFTSGRKDADNGNRPFSLEEVTHQLATNELEAYVFLSAFIYSKDDFQP